MTEDTIDYAFYVDTALRGAVREIVRKAERSGLKGTQHFFISFRTDHPGVVISDMLKSKYPQEITIVLQHQFWDLAVEQDRFKVTLSFNNVPEKLVVPFAALTGFADPSTKFGLQFHREKEEAHSAETPSFEDVAAAEEDGQKEGAEIIALDAFRKK